MFKVNMPIEHSLESRACARICNICYKNKIEISFHNKNLLTIYCDYKLKTDNELLANNLSVKKKLNDKKKKIS